ncbi:50S ribosomal protein L18 [Candidatus Parcubacteria bacterium]|nr:MAG: 50S ribosomal protein L18 [Candidatus Parcubacteria bacterium]
MRRTTQHRIRQERRSRRVRQAVRGDAAHPRLSVFRSNRHIAAQLIDDVSGRTLVAASDMEFTSAKTKSKDAKAAGRRERAQWVGVEIAKRAGTKGIKAARFDRGRYRYHGLVAAVAEGARAGGLHV